MDRELINKYFIDLVKEVMDKYEQFRPAFICHSGGDLEAILDFELYCDIKDNLKVIVTHGASKMVFISERDDEFSRKYVVKIPFDSWNYDYCNEEVKTYNSIEELYPDFTECFAETWKAGTIEFKSEEPVVMYDVPLYIMERADADEDKVEKTSYDYWISCGGKREWYCPEGNEETFNCFKAFYGESLVDCLEDIINEMDINDLHENNVGFLKERPVFIDYSGYFG